jgi:hypothetical protein
MDVLLRLDMVEARRDAAIHVTVYRATQNARDWVRGQQEDAVAHDVLGGNRYVDNLISMVSEMIDSPKVDALTVGDRVTVEHEGTGTVTEIDAYGVTVKIDADGVEVIAAHEQVALIPKTSADSARVTADDAPLADWERELLAMGANSPMVDFPATSELDHMYADEDQDALDAAQAATGIHAACGRKLADHCAYCDTCECGCPVADTIASTDGGIHAECGKPLADHCTNCDECPRVAGPCWCLSTVDAEDDGRPEQVCPCGMMSGDRYHKRYCPAQEVRGIFDGPLMVTDEPVTIVTGSTAPGFEIDFGSEVTQREVTRREAWSIVKRLEYAGVHVPDRLGMVDEVMSGVASYPRTPDEWRHVERCGPAGHCSCPLTVADVATLMTPEEAVSPLHARERGWARRNKVSRSRRRRYARKGH